MLGAVRQDEPDAAAPESEQNARLARRHVGEYILAEAIISLIHIRKGLEKK